jgi:transposase-like protein
MMVSVDSVTCCHAAIKLQLAANCVGVIIFNEHVSVFLAYPREVRTMNYTTNALERVNMRVRKIIKTWDHFPSDEAATKLIYLALRNIIKKWTMPPRT